MFLAESLGDAAGGEPATRMGIAEVAKFLNRPASTTRRWAKQFEDIIPHIEEKNRREYTMDSVRLFLIVGKLFDQGLTVYEVRERLKREVPSGITGTRTPAEATRTDAEGALIDSLRWLLGTWEGKAELFEDLATRTDSPQMAVEFETRSATLVDCAKELRKIIE